MDMTKASKAKTRPNLPWWMNPEIIGRTENQFEDFKSPAAIIAYVDAELGTKAAAELWAGVIDAGASAESLLRDMVELAEMDRLELAGKLSTGGPKPRRKEIEETDFLPSSMKGVNELVLKACAAITLLKVRERCEGIPIQLRDKMDNPADCPVGLHKYELIDVFPTSGALLKQLGEVA